MPRTTRSTCLLLAAAVVLLALLALQVQFGRGLAPFDPLLADWLHRHAHATPALAGALLYLTYMHSTPGILALALLAAGQLLRSRRRRAAGFLLGTTASAQLLNAGLKLLFQRPRPLFEEPLVLLSSYSFPSGHAAGSTALYGALVLLAPAGRQRWQVAAAAVPLLLLVCFSRLYLGAHYLSDVLAGSAVGLAWVAACRLAFDPAASSAARSRQNRGPSAANPAP